MDCKDVLSHFNSTQEAVETISTRLDVSKGTVNRWIKLERIPPAYSLDLMKILEMEIDYSKFTFIEKDQFYTPIETAGACYETFCRVLTQLGEDETTFSYIEPSAGNGSFLSVLPPNRTIGLDIEPRQNDIQQQDYLDWKPLHDKRYVVFGNPPFGLRGNLALRFINHSTEFAEYVCFILPQLFESDGKGVPKRRVKRLNLIYSGKIPSLFYSPEQKEIQVHTIFQIWSRAHSSPKYAHTQNTSENSKLKIYSLSDGNTSSSTRNKKMLHRCDMYIPSTCFGAETMRWYESFEDLPGRRGYGIVFKEKKDEMSSRCKHMDLSQVAFQSTNGAYNIRSSQILGMFN